MTRERFHVPDFFGCSPEEGAALLDLVERAKDALDRELHPHGYNVGFNAGPASSTAATCSAAVSVHVVAAWRISAGDDRRARDPVLAPRPKDPHPSTAR